MSRQEPDEKHANCADGDRDHGKENAFLETITEIQEGDDRYEDNGSAWSSVQERLRGGKAERLYEDRKEAESRDSF
jgi:hypothetical protein